MKFSTYSFQDVTCSFQHPAVGAKSSTGAGIGTISIAMASDRTHHEAAADGKIMVSKLIARNGTIAITMQQTSELHKYLIKWYNYIDIAEPSQWALMTLTINSKNLGDTTSCTGVSPQKLADRPYQAQGQNITWNLMAAEITES